MRIGLCFVLAVLCAENAVAQNAEKLASAAQLDLAGAWHVLVHYRDAAHSERLQWEDRLWVFEKHGAALQWTDYPLVIFQDESGRFERKPFSSEQRDTEAWQPSEAQLRELRAGLRVNARGAKQKTLFLSQDGQWTSADPKENSSALGLSYREEWSIENPASRPSFRRIDVLGSAELGALEGGTRYQTETVEEGGALLRGRYERDAALRGEFWLRRSRLAQQK